MTRGCVPAGSRLRAENGANADTHLRIYVAMRITIEPPEGGAWGPTRMLIVRLQQLGYTVTEWRGTKHELEIT